MRDDVVFKDIRALAATAAVFDGRKDNPQWAYYISYNIQHCGFIQFSP